MQERQSPFVETCEHCRCPRDSEARNTRVRAVYEKHLFFLLWWKALAPHFLFKSRLSINSRSRTAWLCSSSPAPNTGVIVPARASRPRVASAALRPSNSLAYLALNSGHLLGSSPNHLRSAALGGIFLSHKSTLAFVFVSPRGHSLSTKIRLPSPELG
jgi:hypothetical protein